MRRITDRGIKELAALKELKTLSLSRTGVTNKGVAELQKAIPKCRINSRARPDPNPVEIF